MRACSSLLIVLAAGCANPSWSCSYAGDCQDYVAGFNEGQARDECMAGSGTFSSSASCPSTGRVARCTQTISMAAYTHTSTFNYYAPYTADQVRAMCPPITPEAGASYQFQAN